MVQLSLVVHMQARHQQLVHGFRAASKEARNFGLNTRGEFTRITSTIDQTTRVLGHVDVRASQTGRAMRTAAQDSTRHYGALRRSVQGLTADLGGLHRLAAVGGTVLLGREMLAEGNRYQNGLNAFGAVTSATADQMQRASWMATQLGNDLKLPQATAADAAEAMVELAKAGLRTDQAIDAARASLALASAGNLNAADSARYLGDIMDQFALGADQAGRAADVLAATATSASGEIIDIYYAMKYVGPVAAGLKVPIEDVASAVGMLHRSGIVGETAGTSLRRIFTNLAAPTPRMVEGLRQLGIEAWDAEGKFLGMRVVIEGLQHAMHDLSEQEFLAASTRAFGTYALAGVNALAHQGVASYNDLSLAMHRHGTAVDITAARGQGLVGALTQIRTQAKQTGLAVYDALAPGLERVVRLITRGLAAGTPGITTAIEYGRDLATLFGPALRERAAAGIGGLRNELRRLLGPLMALAEYGLASGLGLLLTVGEAGITVLANLADAAEPVVSAVGDLAAESGALSLAVGITTTVLGTATSAVAGLSAILVPAGEAVGAIVGGFGALPGPVQIAIAAMLLSRRVMPVLSGLAAAVSGPLTSAWRGYADHMRVQQHLAQQSEQQIGRTGAAWATLQTRVPIMGQMSAAFRNGQSSADGFAGSVRGAANAVGTGLQGAARGLIGAMGGPWGMALAGATVGLGLLAAQQHQAAQAAAAHRDRIASLTDALRDSGGAIDGSVRSLAARAIQEQKLGDSGLALMDIMSDVGYTLRDVTDAYLGQGDSIEALASRMRELDNSHSDVPYLADTHGRIIVYHQAADALEAMAGEFEAARQAVLDLDSATSRAGGTSAYSRLTAAVGELADTTSDADRRTRALRDALDLLSGGTLSYQAAQARVNAAVLSLNEAHEQGIDEAKGFGDELLNNVGALSTVTRNGQQLYDQLTSLSEAAADASMAAYGLAQQNGQPLRDALEAARTEMEGARDSAVEAAMAYGLTREQAEGVADSLGLLPQAVSILLQTEGLDAALAGLLAVQAEFSRLPGETSIRVDSLTEEAQVDLEELGFTVETIPGTREISISAPTEAALLELGLLVDALVAMPQEHHVSLTAPEYAAIASLQLLQAELQATPDAKTVVMQAPTAQAREELQRLGFVIRDIDDRTVEITVPTTGATAAVSTIQQAINRVTGKTVTVTVNETIVRNAAGRPTYIDGYQYTRARGGIDLYRRSDLRSYAAGGIENHVAQIARPGAWRVWAEPETGGEAYIPLAYSKRPRSRAIAAETVRRLGGNVEWFADGGLTNWRYQPPQLATTVTVAANSRNKSGDFSLSLFTKNLTSSIKTAQQWRKDLETIAQKAGQGVADALEAMGEDGVALARKMASGSASYLTKMAKDLEKLAATARASLSEFTRQLQGAVKDQTAFESNLAKLASLGYTDLAAMLAEQGDTDAEDLAAQAVKDNAKAKQANAAARSAAQTLSTGVLTDLVAIIGAVTGKTVGIHAVADATGLGEDRIIEVANAAGTRLSSALGARADRFLADLAKANKGLAYAQGGIWEPGIYRGTRIRFAEPETGGEAYIPLGAAKRPAATAVLGDVAARFGLAIGPAPAPTAATQVVDARPAAPVIVVRERQPLVGAMNITVSGSSATPEQIGTEVIRRLRTAQRGGRL